MIDQGAFMAVTRIRDGEEESLRALLKDIGNVVDLPTCPIPFNHLTTVHFMRWVVLESIKDATGRIVNPALLVLSTNYDLPLAAHLREVIAVCGNTIHDIYSYCEGYSPGNDLFSFLQANHVAYAAFYVGTRGLGVAQIRQEQELREAIQEYLDMRKPENDEDPIKIREAVQQYVFASPKLAWARERPNVIRWYLHLYKYPIVLLLLLLSAYVLVPMVFGISLWLLPLLTIGLGIALFVFLLAWRQLIVAYEKRDAQDDVENSIPHVKNLVEREDQVVQNQLSHLADVKPEWIRPITLWAVLRAIHLLGRYVYTRGSLGGIPTIHFARWVILKDGRLLFFSNFDGSWVNYLGDFIDKASKGLTAVWSNTVGCPRARGLVGAGASDEQRFKSWTRAHQIFTQVWYSAYEDLSVDNINNNFRIRKGLYGRLSPTAAREWLSRL